MHCLGKNVSLWDSQAFSTYIKMNSIFITDTILQIKRDPYEFLVITLSCLNSSLGETPWYASILCCIAFHITIPHNQVTQQ